MVRKKLGEKKATGNVNFDLRIPIKFHISMENRLGEDFVIKARNENSRASIKLRKYLYNILGIRTEEELFNTPELRKLIKKFRKRFHDIVYEMVEEKTGKNFSKSILPHINEDMGIKK